MFMVPIVSKVFNTANRVPYISPLATCLFACNAMVLVTAQGGAIFMLEVKLGVGLGAPPSTRTLKLPRNPYRVSSIAVYRGRESFAI